MQIPRAEERRPALGMTATNTRSKASGMIDRAGRGPYPSVNGVRRAIHGSIRRNRADEAGGPAGRAGDDRAYERVDSELRKLADAGARGRVDCGDGGRWVRGGGSVGGGEGCAADGDAAQDDLHSEPRSG